MASENVNTRVLKEAVKMVIRQQVAPAVSAKAETLVKDLQALIAQAVDSVSEKMLDETKIEEAAQAARKGAQYIAIQELAKTISRDAFLEAKPMIERALKEWNNIVFEAAEEVCEEIVRGEVAKRVATLIEE